MHPVRKVGYIKAQLFNRFLKLLTFKLNDTVNKHINNTSCIHLNTQGDGTHMLYTPGTFVRIQIKSQKCSTVKLQYLFNVLA